MEMPVATLQLLAPEALSSARIEGVSERLLQEWRSSRLDALQMAASCSCITHTHVTSDINTAAPPHKQAAVAIEMKCNIDRDLPSAFPE